MKFAELLIEKYRDVTNWVGTVLVAWILSLFATQVISLFLPAPKISAPVVNETLADAPSLFAQASSAQDYMSICERNIFDSQKRTACVVESTEENPLDPNAPPVLSDLAATLVGTFVFSNPSASIATIIPKSSGESKSYRIGQSILNEAEIYDIQRNKVFFIRNNRKEYMEVDKLPNVFGSRGAPASSNAAGSGIKINGDKVTVSKAKVDATLQDLNQVIQQSRMVPNYENGQVNGFKIFAIRPESIFEQLGLKNGDVIQRINGVTVDSLEKALPMLELLKTESNIAIDVNRGGSKKSLAIDIQ